MTKRLLALVWIVMMATTFLLAQSDQQKTQDLPTLLSMVHTATCQIRPGVDDEEEGCVQLRVQLAAAYRREIFREALVMTEQAVRDLKARRPRAKVPPEMLSLQAAFDARVKE